MITTDRSKLERVIDTGICMQPGDREWLFEEFFQVQNYERDRRKGYELRLAIRRLLRHSGGAIPGGGAPRQRSRFTMALSAVGERGAKRGTKRGTKRSGPRGRTGRDVVVAAN